MLWTGGKNKKGYGNFFWKGQHTGAHRFSLIMADGKPEGDMEAAHSCRNKHCVAPNHLSWKTPKGNAEDRKRDDTQFRATGEKNGQAKLTSEGAEEIKRLYATGDFTHRSLAAKIGVSRTTVHKVVTGKRW